MNSRPEGKIVTFYSYKGGTGRSMAMANVAWLLASAGKRVLAIDWDLEAPGLHRYFEPFLDDKSLENSTGVIDFVLEFAMAAVSNSESARPGDWFLSYSNILLHAVPVRYEFPLEGALHFVPAGRQDSAYGLRVNSFDWPRFYEKLGGGVMLESMKQLCRKDYDYVLIDSRTGVSDTSGVCTVQMPDELVVCFTLNKQSIYGASAAALSALQQRTKNDGAQTLKIWPLPMRIEFAEKDRLERARALARTRFSSSFTHLEPDAVDVYWGAAEVPYQPYYSYEEVLAVFRDRPRETHSLLWSMELIAANLSGGAPPAAPLYDDRRNQGMQAFQDRTPASCLQDMALLGKEYERIRARMKAGDQRTVLMTAIVTRAQQLAPAHGAGQVGEQLFNEGSDGARIAGIALARKEPQRGHCEMVLEGIARSRSAFEQFHSLRLCESIFGQLDATARARVLEAIRSQLNVTIKADDAGRWALAHQILAPALKATPPGWKVEPQRVAAIIQDATWVLLEIRPTSPTVTFNDVEEHHGLFVNSLGSHYIALPRAFRMSECLVTNRLYQKFVAAGGYENREFWDMPRRRKSLLTQDGRTAGPAVWPNCGTAPEGKLDHPVTGICMAEARAFVRWCQAASPCESWNWALPGEELWEYTARGDAGLIYPWGDAFDASLCNSSESGLSDTSEVSRYPSGASLFGALDMAGNVWEFVDRSDTSKDTCSLRGGSFKNNRYEVRSYLRLSEVPVLHRPPDFGFRLAQTPIDAPGAMK
jgi:formylglycine-generating enzyme required for sulfatase activity